MKHSNVDIQFRLLDLKFELESCGFKNPLQYNIFCRLSRLYYSIKYYTSFNCS